MKTVMTICLVLLCGGCATTTTLRRKGITYQYTSTEDLEVVFNKLCRGFEANWQTTAFIPGQNILSVNKTLSLDAGKAEIYLKRVQWGGVEVIIDLEQYADYVHANVYSNWIQTDGVKKIFKDSNFKPKKQEE